MSKKHSSVLISVVTAIVIALILWVTLLSRIGTDARKLYPPFWSYRAIASGSIRILFEVIGNILLFIPCGLIAVLFFRFNLLQAVFLGILFSLIIECSQWFFWLGAFEIDDLLHNTLGAGLGGYIAKKARLSERVDLSTVGRTVQFLQVAVITILLLCVPFVHQGFRYLSMKSYAALNDRADGAKNLLVLNGEPGYVGTTDIYVAYKDDGSISISGSSDVRSWKRIGQLMLKPGKYSFSGLSGTEEKTIALELECYSKDRDEYIRLTPDIGPIESTIFTLVDDTRIRTYVGVYPGAEGEYIARPVIYREDY